jgi:hypothetical protein
MPADWSRLGFTSGRRTYRGNKLVGGVANSDHLNGTAADFTAPLSVLQAQFPGKRILDEGDHRHVSGLSNVPYHGKQGIAGLVNGIDTTAPKGTNMLQPRKPQQPRMAGLSPLMNQGILAGVQNPMQMAQPNGGPLAEVGEMAPPKPGLFGNGGKGWAALGILGDMLSAYGGQRGVFAPMLNDQRNQEAEDNRFRERLAADDRRHSERAMADAQKPYRFQNNSGDVVEVNPATGEQRVLYMDPAGKTEWAKVTDPTTGEISITPTGQSSRPSAAHIEALRSNPDRVEEFDAKFGRGAAQYYLGGR